MQGAAVVHKQQVVQHHHQAHVEVHQHAGETGGEHVQALAQVQRAGGKGHLQRVMSAADKAQADQHRQALADHRGQGCAVQAPLPDDDKQVVECHVGERAHQHG